MACWSSSRTVVIWYSLGKGCPSCKARAIRERYVVLAIVFSFACCCYDVDVVFICRVYV